MNIVEGKFAAGTGLPAFFGHDGALAHCVAGFAPRAEQLAMAEAVAGALRTGRHLVVEAGTGTGKTLAYLVPALLSGQKVVLSTGTRTLQDQLFHRDLPMLGKALGRPVDVRLLKGRANYLCLYRLDRLQLEPDGYRRLPGISNLFSWARCTGSGDISEANDVPEDSPLWSRVTSTAENCLGTKCPRFDECHVAVARKLARDADVVVVNHHLLMADLTMKDEGFGDLLPGADAVIVDEAHHFPDVAQAFFNVSVSSGQLGELLSDVRGEALGEGVFEVALDEALVATQNSVNTALLALPTDDLTIGWNATGDTFHVAVDHFAEALDDLILQLDAIRGASAALQRCFERASTHRQSLESITSTADDEGLRWIRRRAKGFTLTITPLDASEELNELLNTRPCTWVFTSATLAVGNDFKHFTARLGMEDLDTRQIPSPFAYADIARLYLPSGMPQPSAQGFAQACVAAIQPVLEASRGRAFLLFTSHRALRRAAELMHSTDELDFPLLVQGTAPRTRLLDRFAQLENAVLLGTTTFWEGVDIRGHGLVFVAIDRLPFASPGDPMLSARLEAIRKRNGNPFREYQLPQAVLSLKQGIGRLIRDYDDYGVIMICDPRLTQKSYGRVFLDSLPPMPVTDELSEIMQFFAERESAVA